jgi:hypothetical protein
MGTRKSVSKILDQAADILEKRGFTTSKCYDPESGGYCALGAIARAAYPKAKDEDIDSIAYAGVEYNDDADCTCESCATPKRKPDPRYVEAVTIAAQTILRRKNVGMPAGIVYDYNDCAKSPKQVVKMLRRAAEKARES